MSGERSLALTSGLCYCGEVRNVIAGLLLALLVAATPAVGQGIESPEAALAQDAAEYAKEFGVSPDEATRRLIAQEQSVAITDRLADRYRDRLAGISIEHRPVYRIVVSLTGDEPVRTEHIRLAGLEIPIEFHTGARATRDRVIWAMTYHQQQIRAALRGPPAMGLDPRTGELVIILSTATEKPDAIEKKIEKIAGVPVDVRLVDRMDVNLSAVGGGRLEGTSPDDGKRYLCTTGFTVTDGTRYGIATAAHCLDNLTYYGPKRVQAALDYSGQWGWGYRDVQINLSADVLPPLFFSDTAKAVLRPVTGQRGRQGTRAGDFVCHRGERSGYSCAVVELTDFAPAGDLCGGACLPTWVTVQGPKCKGGDSGGPVFVGTTAMGILKGASYRRDGSCAFYFYMSLDYLPAGWSLVISPAQGWVPPPDPMAVPPFTVAAMMKDPAAK